jgi:hypothetical protein
LLAAGVPIQFLIGQPGPKLGEVLKVDTLWKRSRCSERQL